MTTARGAVEVLNRIHATDPTVLPRLIDERVPCNERLANDPTVQVGSADGSENGYEVGILGVLNGIFGIRVDGLGHIGACYDAAGTLTGFVAQ